MTEKSDLFIPAQLRNNVSTFSIRELHNVHTQHDNDENKKENDESNPAENAMNSTDATDFRSGHSYHRWESITANTANNAMYHLVFNIEHCIFKTASDSKLLFSIWDNTINQMVTEQYSLHLTDNNFPIAGSPEDCKVLFKNLPYDLLQHDLWICGSIYRIGQMIAPDIVSTKSASRKKKKKQMDISVTRPFGAVVIPLKSQITPLMKALGEEILFEPNAAPLWCPDEEVLFPTMIMDLITGKTSAYYTPPLSLGIAHGMTLFQGDISALKEVYPHFDKLTVIQRLKIDLSLSEERHVLYLDLKSVSVTQRGKYAACNVGCKISLRHNETGKPLPGCVLMGKSRHCGFVHLVDAAPTPIYYHLNDPVMNQQYQVLIPRDLLELEKCHLYLSFFHFSSSKKPEERGFAFLKLFEDEMGNITRNGEYQLDLWKHEKSKDSRPCWYLQDNATRKEGKRANTQIGIEFCSTKIYSNPDVHYLMTYSTRKLTGNVVVDKTKMVNVVKAHNKIVNVVRAVQKQQFITLLQVMDDLLDAIFTIFLNDSNEQLICQLYALLVFILSEGQRNTNKQFRHRIAGWIERRFCVEKVWRILVKQQSGLLEWIASDEAKDMASHANFTEKIRTLQHSTRGIEFLFDIMKKSKDIEILKIENPQNKNDNDIGGEYNRKIMELFSSLNWVMQLTKPAVVAGIQSLSVRHFGNMLDRMPVGKGESRSPKLTQTVVSFIQSISNKGLNNSIDKLLLIRRVLHRKDLETVDILKSFLNPICDILNYHMGQTLDEKAICITIIRDCLPFLDPKRRRTVYNPETSEMEISPILKSNQSYPSGELYTIFAVLLIKSLGILNEIRSVDLSQLEFAQKIFGQSFARNQETNEGDMIPSDEQLSVHQDMVMTIADLLRVLLGAGVVGICSDDLFAFNQKCESINDAVSLMMRVEPKSVVPNLEDALQSCINLLEDEIFPKEWIIMRMVKIELSLRCFSWLYVPLEHNYLSAEAFVVGKSLWKKWLKLGVLFLEDMDDLALEDMDVDRDKDRLDIMKQNYGDLRLLICAKLTKSWNALTPHRAALGDTMIKASILASVSEVDEMQLFALKTYFGMMCSEFEATGSLDNVETHTIDLIDHLTAKYSHKEKAINKYLDFFRVHVRKQLDNIKPIDGYGTELQEMGYRFLSAIERLYGYFVRLNNPKEQTHEDRHTAAALELLKYLEESEKDELYNRYMHHLGVYHQSLKNHTEAGICFLRHAKRLGWSDRILPEEGLVSLREVPEWKRAVQCLELSYKQFMLGESWEMAVAVSQLLAQAYEKEIYDLRSLASVLERQSHVWKLIETQERVFHSAYLVRFHDGQGDYVTFVYKSGNGKRNESVRDFTERIHSMYAEEKNEDEQSDNHRIEIMTLTPSSKQEMKGGAFKFDEGKHQRAPLRVKKYYRNNETDTFLFMNSLQRKTNKEDNEFRDLWSKKTYVLCEDTLPTVSRRVEVIEEEVVEFSPFQTAINNMVMANVKLRETIETLENDPMKSTHEISMRLNGCLDAAVQGGINKYREAFFDGAYFSEYPLESCKVGEFVAALKQQMEIAKEGLDAYDQYAIDSLQPHVEHLKQRYKKQGVQLLEFFRETDRCTRDL